MTSLATDFNVNPYFNDFDENKNFHSILFKPGVAVQAREVNQLQTILQDQISRFGQNILKEGTIIQGGDFIEETNIHYIKLRDNDLLGTRIDISDWIGKTIVGSITGLKALVVSGELGLESQRPNLNTLYVKYLNSVNDIKIFNSTENLNRLDAQGDVDTSLTAIIAGSVNTGSSPALGNTYGVRCGEGIIFQRGYFSRFSDALTIVSKYSLTPDAVVVGFETQEELINHTVDASLLDNASGFNNYNAPGADRLKLIPKLVTKTLAQSKTQETFLAIQEYVNGKVVRRRTDTQFNTIETLVENRTSEESGNYYVRNFYISTAASSIDTANNFTLSVGTGIAYVDGKRVETLADTYIEIPKPTQNETVSNQDIVANYGNFITVTSLIRSFSIGSLDSIQLRNVSNTVIGTANLRSISKIDTTNFRLHLFNIRMATGQSFSSIRNVIQGTATATVVLDSGSAVLKDAGSFNSLLFPIGKSFIKSVLTNSSDFSYRGLSVVATGAGTTVTITLPVGESWPYTGALNSTQLAELIITNNTDGALVTSFTASVSGQTLTVSGLTTAKTYGVYYSAKKGTLSIAKKTLKDVYIKINCNTNITGLYGLGLPDVQSIVGIWQGATYSESNANVTSSFTLEKNVDSNFYGISNIIKNKSVTLTNADRLLVKVKVFETTTAGDCYTADSYVYTGSIIGFQDIPILKTSSNSIYLRDSIDFRPYSTPTSVYAITIGAATEVTIPFSATAITFGPKILPVPSSSIEISYQFYLGRKDLVYIDTSGSFQILSGIAAKDPITPTIPNRGMVLAEITIPPFPTLPYGEAVRLGKNEYGIDVKLLKNRRYTMTDIGVLDQRLKNLEEYVSLSLLEKSAADLAVTDSLGLNRFKNGIFVDSFDSLTFAEVTSPEFLASIDSTEREIHPKIRAIPLDLKIVPNVLSQSYISTSTMVPTGTKVLINQPFATRQKNCTTNFYKFNGSMRIDPEYDSGVDTYKAPNINFDIDLTAPFVEFTEALAEIIPIQRATQSVARTNVGGSTTTTVTTTNSRLNIESAAATITPVGDFITDFRFNPFMRSAEIKVKVDGLRPNTRFYAYFDGKSVDANVALGKLDATQNVVKTTGFGGNILRASSIGTLQFVFKIPARSFFVGEKKLEIFDVSTYNSLDAITSYASVNYNAYNFSVGKTSLTATTRIPIVNTIRSTSTNSFRTRNESSNDRDPLSQTFFVDSGASLDNSLFVTSLDLFFATKSLTNGITVELRETVNGYPSGVTLPLSKAHLLPADIFVDQVSGIIPTTITFESPIALKTNKEYAIVLMPDANDPNYLVWISKVGDQDLATGISVNKDTSSGVLFTSTNNRAWTPYQDEDLKFKLNKAIFTVGVGEVTLETRNHEFLEVNTVIGSFQDGERVFVSNTTISASLNVIAGNNVITGNVNFQSIFSAGEHITISANTNYQSLKIASANTTALTLVDIPIYSVTGVPTAIYRSSVGVVSYYSDRSTQKFMVLKDSSAKTGLKFTTGNQIIGETSKASALITVIDLPISFLQTNIYKALFPRTRLSMIGSLYDGTNLIDTNLSFDSNNYLSTTPYLVKSFSDNLTGSNLLIKLKLETDNVDTSPIIDHSICSLFAYTYIINNDSVDEKTNQGNSTSKYITKQIQLNDGMDADDFKVYLTAYKPVNTEIEVYVKFKSTSDSSIFDAIPWTKLDLDKNSSSSLADRFDYKDYTYSITKTVKLAGEGAFLDSDTIKYINSDGSVYINFKTFTIKIVMLTNTYSRVPRIKDIRALALS